MKGFYTPAEMVEIFDKFVRGQDDAKRMLAVALANRYRRTKLSAEDRKFIKKQNILIEGPTGSGKTALMKVLREQFGLPVLEVDITEYSEAGYHGKSVDEMIKELQMVDFKVPGWFGKKDEPKKEEKPAVKEAELSFDAPITKSKESAQSVLTTLRILLVGMVGGRLYGPNTFNDPNIGGLMHNSIEDFSSESPNQLLKFFHRGIDLVEQHNIDPRAKFAEYSLAAIGALPPFEELGDENKELTDEFLKKHGLTTTTVPGLIADLLNLDVSDYNALWGIKSSVQDITAWPETMLAAEKSGHYREMLKRAVIGYFFRAMILGLLKSGKIKVEEAESRTAAMQRLNGKDMVKELQRILKDGTAEEVAEIKAAVTTGMPILTTCKVSHLNRNFRSWTNGLSKIKLDTGAKILFPSKMTNAWTELKEMSADSFWEHARKEISTSSPKEARDAVQHSPFFFSPPGDNEAMGLGMPFMPLRGMPGGLGMMFGMGGGASVGGDKKDFMENFAVVFIDEIDKIIQDANRSGDVSRMGVQRGLLKLVEGGVYNGIDTSNILFVGAGAFSGTSPAKLLPELLGRFPIRAKLRPLQLDDYVAICKLERSAFNMYLKMISVENVKVNYDEDTFEYIAQLTELENQEYNLGARRIEGIVERVFEPVMFAPETYLESGFDIRGETLRKQLRG